MKRISISVETDDQNVLARASEAFARAGTGLALEGVDVFLMWSDEGNITQTNVFPAEGDQDDQGS